jgi:hypothetical protein
VRGLTLILGLSTLMSVGVVVGSVALNAAWTDADDSAAPPMVDMQVPSVETPVDLPVAPQPKTVLLRMHAPGGRCWSATIAGRRLQDGCGSVELPLEVEGFVLVQAAGNGPRLTSSPEQEG